MKARELEVKTMAKLLIYIPAYKNHLKLAIDQAKKIRDQCSSNDEIKKLHNVEIYLSVNGLSGELNIPDNLFDYVYHTRVNIGGDANISRGFTEALKIKPDYFWQLSCDDTISDVAILKIFDLFKINDKAKLIVAKKEADLPSEYSIGLISSVVYNFEFCEIAFPMSFYFGWTGWGQLSVMLKILEIYKEIDVAVIDPKYLYNRMVNCEGSSLTKNASNYQHSYYGDIVLRLINNKNRIAAHRIILTWVLRNFVLHNFYSKAVWPPVKELDVPDLNNWRKYFTSTIIKGNSKFGWLIYIILRNIPFKSLLRK
jgi:hypothetical protein